MKTAILSIPLAFLLITGGCSVFRNAGSDLGEGLGESLEEEADTIGTNFVRGMRESLTSEESKRKLDSLISRLGENANAQLRSLRDSLLGEATRSQVAALRNELIGEPTLRRLIAVRDSFFNDYLQQYVSTLAGNVGPHLLNDSTMARLGGVRDTILGVRSNALIKAIVDTAMMTISTRLDRDINPKLRDSLGFIEKNATWLIVVTGIVAIGIIWFVWRQKEKYLRMSKVLTVQIAQFPDKTAKEKLKDSISQNARTIGVEDELRTLLDKQGILHLDKA